ncbi:MAG: type VI secretion system transmembrane protein TssO [Prevotellaceae bacterium]|jgi:hypothetical protein|nr:type VI secretion system transmembrane protein TssO [Prevotellaceae bacterium]
MDNQIKDTKNRRERFFGFLYVGMLFMATTVICCLCLVYYTDTGTPQMQKTFAISKMKRITTFQSAQNAQSVIVDSLYNKILNFNPGVKASYEEDEIKYYLNEFKNLYENNKLDNRYKIFLQISEFYGAWFYDKQELWSKQQNIVTLGKNLEDCGIGLQKKKDELKNKK